MPPALHCCRLPRRSIVQFAVDAPKVLAALASYATGFADLTSRPLADLGGGGKTNKNGLVHQPRKVIVAADAAGAIPAGLTDRAVQVVRAGLAAAIAVASDQGLPTAGPRVLSCRGNLIVHLIPAPVVARVATLTGWTRADPYRWLARQVAVAGHLAKRGGPVVAPASRADPGPHRSHGLAVSLWDYVPPSEQRPRPEETSEALAQLHLAAADFPGQLPDMSPARELISEGLAALEREHVITQQELAALQGRRSSVLVELATGYGPRGCCMVMLTPAISSKSAPAGLDRLGRKLPRPTELGPGRPNLLLTGRPAGAGCLRRSDRNADARSSGPGPVHAGT